MKAKTQDELLNKLYSDNGLTKEDVFTKFGKNGRKQYAMITRSGIEKIQAANEIKVQYEPIAVHKDYCVVKATGMLPISAPTKSPITLQGTTANPKIPVMPQAKIVETFGSSQDSNSTLTYYMEIAEARALSRVVLKLMGLYEYGFIGEDEATEMTDKPTNKGTKAAAASDKALENLSSDLS